MCRNHSHLTTRFVGEDTGGELPVLMHLLEKSMVSIENRTGTDLMIPTSGLVYVPSYLLGGWSASPLPLTGERATSVFFMPDGAATGILEATLKWLISSGTLPQASNAKEDSLTDRVLAWAKNQEDDLPF